MTMADSPTPYEVPDIPQALRGTTPASAPWHRFRDLQNAGGIAVYQGNAAAARQHYDAAYRETLTVGEGGSPDGPAGVELDGEGWDARAGVLGNLAALREHAGDLAGALELINQAIDAGQRAEALIGDERGTRAMRVAIVNARAQTLIRLGRIDDALHDVDEAREMLLAVDPAHPSRALLDFQTHNTKAGILVEAERLQEAEDEAQRALQIALASDPRVAAHTYMTLAAIAERTGDLATGAEYLALAHELSGITGDPVAAQLSTENLARGYLRDGRLDDAERLFTEAERLAVSGGLVIRAASCRYGLACVAMKRGDLRAADAALATAITAFEQAGAQFDLIWCHSLAGDLHTIKRRFPQADKAYRRAWDLCETGSDRAAIDVRRAEMLAQWSEAAFTPMKRAALQQQALALTVPAALATDALRHGFTSAEVRERWTTTVAAPSMTLAFTLASELRDTKTLLDLIEHASARVSLQSTQPLRSSVDVVAQTFAAVPFVPTADHEELPLAASAILDSHAPTDARFALPPRLDTGLGELSQLDAWIDAAEERYGIAIRSQERVATW